MTSGADIFISAVEPEVGILKFTVTQISQNVVSCNICEALTM